MYVEQSLWNSLCAAMYACAVYSLKSQLFDTTDVVQYMCRAFSCIQLQSHAGRRTLHKQFYAIYVAH
eukprot:5028759-Pyramimonas_sp.AAC.1